MCLIWKEFVKKENRPAKKSDSIEDGNSNPESSKVSEFAHEGTNGEFLPNKEAWYVDSESEIFSVWVESQGTCSGGSSDDYLAEVFTLDFDGGTWLSYLPISSQPGNQMTPFDFLPDDSEQTPLYVY